MNKIFLVLLCIYTFHTISSSQSDESTCYFFGHSLIDHRPPIIPTPSNETTVPHWLQLLANHANKDFSASGKYGFLPQHATQEVFSQWGYDIVTPAWESDYEDFSVADFSTIFITAGNFIQWQSHTEDYYSDPGISPLSATLDIIDYVSPMEDSLKIIIYENWPDMGGIAPNFPPNEDQLENYYSFSEGEFHDWWIAYHNDLDLNRPDLNIKMVPIGPMFADLFQNTNLKDIPVTEIYEDNAPHGRASLYFLASLASYIAIYEEKPPLDFEIPEIIHSTIIEEYEAIIDRMWETCIGFTFDDGRNRVFTQNVISTVIENNTVDIAVFPNPTQSKLRVEGLGLQGEYRVMDINGRIKLRGKIEGEKEWDISQFPDGIYFIEIINSVGNEVYFEKIIKQ